MNILIPYSWLQKYLDTNATPADIQKCLSLCGPSVERLEKKNGDFIFDIEITTNRVDCMSVIGIAREAAAILPHFGFSAKLKSDPLIKKTHIKTAKSVNYLKVDIDPELCARFSAILIKNVSVKSSPKEMIERLEKVGMRGLNNLIDASNLLMHEYGQPVHVFDYDRIADQTMILRTSRVGETIVTLDGKTHILPGDDIVIEDGSGNLIDLCGIMGGQNSAVSETTKNVLLFVQTYSGKKIRTTSMNLAHRTSAAALFEKELPTEQVLPTLEAGIQLIKDLAGGNPESDILDILSIPELKTSVTLSKPLLETAEKIMGIKISHTQISSILTSLGFDVSSPVKISVPYFRKNDISIPEDLVEEIARIYGYHNLPAHLMSGPLPPPGHNQDFYWENRIKIALKYFGFNEIYTYSLVSKTDGLKLANPLSSEWVGLRTSLYPSHAATIEKNRGKSDRLDFFEIANIYLPRKNNLPLEQSHLIISTSDLDLFRLKGIVQALLADIGISDIQPDIKSAENHIYWEIPMSELIAKATNLKTYTPISKYSPIIEDVNIHHQTDYASIVNQLNKISPLISKIELKDKYGEKLTIRITFHSDDRQLSSADIANIRDQIANQFNK